MSEAANYLENLIAQKLFNGVDFTINNFYGGLAVVPPSDVAALEDKTDSEYYGYEITSGTHGGYNDRFEITWNVTDNIVTNSNTETWTVTSNWPSVPNYILVFNDTNLNNGDLIFYAPIPGLPGTITTDDVIRLKPNRFTITID